VGAWMGTRVRRTAALVRRDIRNSCRRGNATGPSFERNRGTRRGRTLLAPRRA
jgi:hypothetical protein